MEKMLSIIERVTYHAVYDESIMTALAYAKENGFAGIQVAVETPHLSFEQLGRDDRRRISDFVSDNSMRLSLHAPDDSVSLFQTSPYLLDGVFAYYDALFAFGEAIGASIVTFHLGSLPTYSTNEDPPRLLPDSGGSRCASRTTSSTAQAAIRSLLIWRVIILGCAGT